MFLITRSLFFLSLLCAVVALSGASMSLLFDLPAALQEVPWMSLLAGAIVGGLLSTVTCRFVVCSHCGEAALLIPDPSEAGNIHQPWRRHCCHCSRALP